MSVPSQQPTIVFPGDLAPWDQIPHFRTPVETTYVGTGSTIQIALADPNRTVLIISNNTNGIVFVSTNPNVVANQGMSIGTALGQVAITSQQHGPLVNVAWYWKSASLSNITVQEVFANTWPDASSLDTDAKLEAMNNVASQGSANGGSVGQRYGFGWPQPQATLPNGVLSRCRDIVSKLRQAGIAN